MLADMDPAAYERGLLDGDAGKPADPRERDRGYISGYIEGKAHRGGFECTMRDHETIMRHRERKVVSIAEGRKEAKPANAEA